MIRRRLVLALALVMMGCVQTDQRIDAAADRAEVERILALADRQDDAGLEAYLAHVSPDVVLIPHNQPLVEGREAYRAHVEAGWTQGQTTLRHEA